MFMQILDRLPTIPRVFNRLFLYAILVNVMLAVFEAWLIINGGGGGNLLSNDFIEFDYLIKIIRYGAESLFVVFYIFALLPFGIIFSYIIAFLYFIIGIVGVFLFVVFDAQLNAIFFGTFLATNFAETQEFLESYLFIPKALIALFAFLFVSLLFIFPFRFLKFKVSFLSHRVLSLCLLIAVIICGISNVNKIKKHSHTMFLHYNKLIKNIDIIYQAFQEHSYINQYASLTKDVQQNVSDMLKHDNITLQDNPIPNVVLIIGESTQRNYMQIYGYPLPTTPYLSTLQKDGSLIVFQDVIAPHAHTDKVLQKLLTFSNYENSATPWFQQQNILDILGAAGYTTHWISNQEAISIWGNAPEVLSRRAKIVKYSNQDDSFTSGKAVDGILIPMVKQSLENDSIKDKQFYIVHLMGTHGAYVRRYLSDFAVFGIKDLRDGKLDYYYNNVKTDTNTQLTDHQAHNKTEYLNAILYNDYVVNELIKLFANKDSMVIYLSDHGDEVFDFRYFVGHNDASGSRFMVEVPFMVYLSDDFKKNHKDIASRIESAKNKPFMSDDFIHALLDIMGIKSNDFVEQRSLFSDKYNDKRERIFIGKNYDTDIKTTYQYIAN